MAPVQLGKWMVLFCDEINLPDMDSYGENIDEKKNTKINKNTMQKVIRQIAMMMSINHKRMWLRVVAKGQLPANFTG